MKRYSTYITCLWLTIGAMLLSACNHDQWEQEIVTDGLAATRQDSCYINLHIVGAATTRTIETATAEENTIYDGILAIFEGTNASEATLKTATAIDQLINNPGTSVNVQVTQRLAVGTHDYVTGKNLYVLVLLNTTPTGFTIGGTNNNVLFFNGNPKTGNTFSQIQGLTINSVGSIDKHVGLFMMNSNGLVEATALFDTEAEARVGSTVTINVERAAARIRVTNNIGSTPLSTIKLNDNDDSHPSIHRMTWALATEGITGFGLYQQQSHQSDDVIYVPENTSEKTRIIVETKLKDGSFLIDDCYKFAYSEYLYTSVSQFVAFLKKGWDAQRGGYGLSARSAEEIYEHMKLKLADNGKVTVTFTMDTSDYQSAEITGLANLKAFLEANTIGFKNGKMYYTYELNEVRHNNVYNLTLSEESLNAYSSSLAIATVTFKFDQGNAGQTALFNNSSWFSGSEINVGSNFTYDGKDKTRGQTKLQSGAKQTAAAESNAIDFMFTPQAGRTFTPSSVSFKATRYGTDGGDIVVSWVNSDNTIVPLTHKPFKVNRDNATPSSISEKVFDVTGITSSGTCGLRINLYNLDANKQVGFSDIVIEGTIDDTSQTKIAIGRPTP